MPETLERPAATPAESVGALGWSSSETPLPDTVFVDGPTEAAMIGRRLQTTPDERGEADSPHSQLLYSSLARLVEPSSAVTERWVESLSRAADTTRAELQLVRQAMRFALTRWLSATDFSSELPVRLVQPAAPLRLYPARAARDCKNWLNVSWDDLADATGISAGSFYYWQANPSANPRPATVEPLYRLHSSLAAARRFADTEQLFEQWLRVGSSAGESPRERALAGELDAVRVAVQSLVFGDGPATAVTRSSRRFTVEDEVEEMPETGAAEASQLRRKSTRRARTRLR